MKILLIDPPYSRLRGVGPPPHFPLSLGYLAGTLAESGFEPRIYNADLCRPGEPLPVTQARVMYSRRAEAFDNLARALHDGSHYVWREIREVLDTEQPDMVGITALSMQFGSAAKVAELVKKWRQECPVIMGGHHFTYMPEVSLQSVPAIDVGVVGEGEETFLELCNAFMTTPKPDFSKIPGIAYREGSRVCVSRRPPIENLDSLPFPRKDVLVFPENYPPFLFSTLIYGRGCPWNCRFCSSKTFWGRRTRMRSADNCLQEIDALMRDFGCRHFQFWDDAFSLRKKDIIAFCEKKQQADMHFTFATATRANLVDKPLVDMLDRSGCIEIYLGVESGSPSVLQMIQKDLDLDRVRTAVRLIEQAHIGCGLFFMFGFPRETEEDMDMTFDLIREFKRARIAFNLFDPLPGSELYDETIQLGRMDPDENWLGCPLWPNGYFVTTMPREKFEEKFWHIANYVYARNESRMQRLRYHLPLLLKNPGGFARKAMRRLSKG